MRFRPLVTSSSWVGSILRVRTWLAAYPTTRVRTLALFFPGSLGSCDLGYLVLLVSWYFPRSGSLEIFEFSSRHFEEVVVIYKYNKFQGQRTVSGRVLSN